MFDFHKDKQTYFNYQFNTAKEYIIPFLEGFSSDKGPIKVLEIGCGEAGVLKAFYTLGHDCTGIELAPTRIKLAKEFFKELPETGKVEFIVENIYNIDPNKDLKHKYDLIILKDVIEHIPGQKDFLLHLREFLAPHGSVFFGFPPWQMPFGGHQQITNSRWTKLPYIHLLPRPIYKWLIRNLPERQREELMELVDTGLSIEKFEKLIKETDYSVIKKKHFLFNPIYKYKFGLKPRKQWKLISMIPYFRNFVTTCVYYQVELIDNK
jgi:SAM-dependent methyltransferase